MFIAIGQPNNTLVSGQRAFMHLPLASQKGTVDEHTCTNPHTDDEDDDVDLLIICCWFVRIDLPPLSLRCSQLASVLNFLSMLCRCVNVWPEPNSPIDNLVQPSNSMSNFSYISSRFSENFYQFRPTMSTQASTNFFPFTFSHSSGVWFFRVCIGRPLHRRYVIYYRWVRPLHRHTRTQTRIIMIIAHAAFVGVWSTAHNQTESSGHWRDACASPSYLGESERHREICIIITFRLGIGSCSCGIFALVCRRRRFRFFFCFSHTLVGTWEAGVKCWMFGCWCK